MAVFCHRNDHTRAFKQQIFVAVYPARGPSYHPCSAERLPGSMERAMSEIEFDRVMEAVRNAVMIMPAEDSSVGSPTFEGRLKAANDNLGHPWPIVAFPEGWHFA